MNISKIAKELKAGKKVKRKDWGETTYLWFNEEVEEISIISFWECAGRFVSDDYIIDLEDMAADDWEIYNGFSHESI